MPTLARTFAVGTGALMLAGLLAAQDSPRLEFDAAVVKPAELPAGGFIRMGPPGGPGTSDPTRIHYNLTTLKQLLVNAYGVKNYQINGPSWLDSERYEVTATMPPGTTKEQAMVMLQNLLADRFQLKLHHVTKDLPLYELVVGKNGPKLKPHVDDPNQPDITKLDPGAPPPMGKDGKPIFPAGATMMMINNGKLHMRSSKVTMARLSDLLSSNLGNPVIDKTGLTGEYDIDLEFSSDGLAGLPPPPPGAPGGRGGFEPGRGPAPESDAGEPVSLTAAVQEQLGLKLDQKKGPLDVLVIDHAEKVPTEN